MIKTEHSIFLPFLKIGYLFIRSVLQDYFRTFQKPTFRKKVFF